jgi:hypothetical protein
MAERDENIRCPLCEGAGELSRLKLTETLTSPELRKRLDARVNEILQAREPAGAGAKARDFQKEVHSWNPAQPIWNRSPKE